MDYTSEESKNRIKKHVGTYIPRKVLVIGNGFDLAHGLLTSYEHFQRIIKNQMNSLGTISDGKIKKL